MIKYKYLLVHLNQILNNNQTLNSYTNQQKVWILQQHKIMIDYAVCMK